MNAIKTSIVGLVLLSFLIHSGCATLFTGTSNTISILSEPSGGKVYLNGNFAGNTPLPLSLKRDKDYNILVKKEGFNPGTATITRSFNTISVLNLFFILFWVVDFASGAIWKFDQEAVTVLLEKDSANYQRQATKTRVMAGANMIAAPYNGRMGIFIEQPKANSVELFR